MRKITTTGAGRDRASAAEDDAIDVESGDRDRHVGVPASARGGLRKLFQLPAASNGGDGGRAERRQRAERRRQADRREPAGRSKPTGGKSASGEARRRPATEVGATKGGSAKGSTASSAQRVGGRAERGAAAAQQQEAQATLTPVASHQIRPDGGEHGAADRRERAITMEWVETTGRTIAEALDAALDELGVDEDDVEYEVLEQPKSGFLGRLGSSEGRIRARVKPISREKPGERQAPQGPTARRARRQRSRQRGQRPGPRQCAGRTGRRRRQRRAVGGAAAVGGSGGRRSAVGAERAWRGVDRLPEQRRRRGATSSNRGAPWTPSRATFRSRSRRPRPRRSPRGWSTRSTSGARAKSVIDDDVVVVEVTGDNLGLLVGPEGRDPARDRGAGAHRGAAPDRRARRPHPRRRRRLPGQAPRGARGVHPQPGRRRCSRPAGPRRSSRCRPATARSCTTPRPRSTASPPSPRAKTRAAASCCAPPDPLAHRLDGRTRTRAGRSRRAADVLEEARELGLPRARARSSASSTTPSIWPGRSGAFDGQLPRSRERRRPSRARARRRVARRPTGCSARCAAAPLRLPGAARSSASASAVGSTVACGRAEALARDAGAPPARFDLVVARSFGPPAVTAECAVGLPACRAVQAGGDGAA